MKCIPATCALLAPALALAAGTALAVAGPGAKLWSTPLSVASAPIQSTPALGPDGTVYVGAVTSGGGGGALFALNAATGSVKWIRYMTGGVISSPVVSPDGDTIYVCTTAGWVSVISRQGRDKADYQLPSGAAIRSSPALDLTGGTLYLNAEDGYLYALYVNGADISPAWSANIQVGGASSAAAEPLTTSPAVGADGTIYTAGSAINDAGFWVEELFSFAPSGQCLANVPVGDGISGSPVSPISSVSLGLDGTIYVGDRLPDDRSRIATFDPLDLGSRGFLNTTQAIAASAMSSAAVVDAGGNVYAADEGGTVYGFRVDGLHWQRTPPGVPLGIDTTPALTADGYFWLVASDGHLHSFDTTNGDQAAYAILGSAGVQTASSPVVGPDGTVYVAYNTNVFAVSGYGPPARAFWPCFRLNARNQADVRNDRWTAGVVTSVTVTPIAFNSAPSSAYGINGDGIATGYGTDTTYGTTAFGAAPPAYAPDSIGYNVFRKTPSYGQAIDPFMDVVGYYLNSSHYTGFDYDLRVGSLLTLESFDTTNYPDAYAYALSPDGDRVVGASVSPDGRKEATAWTTTNIATIASAGLGTLGGNSIAYGVNNSGRVVGASQPQAGGVYHAFFSVYGSKIQPADDLGSEAGAAGSSTAYAINGFNQLAGKTQTTTGINRPFYKNYSMALQTTETTWRLPSPMPTSINGDDGAVLGMNTRGQMVGTANTGIGSSTHHAFIWTPNNPWFGLKDLNSLLSPTQQSQWVLSGATGINDAGDIVGYGTYNGQTTAFVLHPQ